MTRCDEQDCPMWEGDGCPCKVSLLHPEDPPVYTPSGRNEPLDSTIVLVPPSTLYPGTVGRWHHDEGCPVEIENRCTCDDKEDKTNG